MNPFASSAAPSTANPIALLRACHVKMADHAALIERVRQHIEQNGVDDAAREAINRVVNYFSKAAPLHHQDEEIDLFPLLEAAAKADDAEEITDALEFLRLDHTKLEQTWAAMREQLEQLLSQGTGQLDAGRVRDFIAAYQRHIETENSLILPYAQAVIDRDNLGKIGASMQARRTPV